MARDSNGHVLAPRWMAIAVPMLCAGAAWGASQATVQARMATVEAVQKRQEDVLERLTRIETILDERLPENLRRPR